MRFRHPFRSNPRGRLLAAERLEQRTLLACDVIFSADGQLSVLGDDGANHVRIEIVDDIVRVECDGRSAGEFTGVARIDVQTFGGDDIVSVHGTQTGAEDYSDFGYWKEIHVQLGAGADHFTADLRSSGLSTGDLGLQVNGGGEDDIFDLTAGEIGRDANFEHSRMVVAFDAGDGVDHVNVNARGTFDDFDLSVDLGGGTSDGSSPKETLQLNFTSIKYNVHVEALHEFIAGEQEGAARYHFSLLATPAAEQVRYEAATIGGRDVNTVNMQVGDNEAENLASIAVVGIHDDPETVSKNETLSVTLTRTHTEAGDLPMASDDSVEVNVAGDFEHLAVAIDSGDGDDVVSLNLHDVTAASSLLDIDTGDGNDALKFHAADVLLGGGTHDWSWSGSLTSIHTGLSNISVDSAPWNWTTTATGEQVSHNLLVDGMDIANGAQVHWRSNHPGVSSFVFMDGSVRGVSVASNAVWSWAIDGGEGGDRIDIELADLTMAGDTVLSIAGGEGVDDIDVRADEVLVEGTWLTSIDPGPEEARNTKPQEIVVVGSKLRDEPGAALPGLYIRGNDEGEQLELRLTDAPSAPADAHGHLDFLKFVGDPATAGISFVYQKITWEHADPMPAIVDIATGDGDDAVHVAIGQPVTFTATITMVSVDMGEGNDSFQGDYFLTNGSDTLVNVDGGGGYDSIVHRAEYIEDISPLDFAGAFQATGVAEAVSLALGNAPVSGDLSVNAVISVESDAARASVVLAPGEDVLRDDVLIVDVLGFGQVDLTLQTQPNPDRPEKIDLNTVSFEPTSQAPTSVHLADRDDGVRLEAANFHETRLVYETFDPARNVNSVQLAVAGIAFTEAAGTSFLLADGEELEVQAANFNEVELALETQPNPDRPEKIDLNTVSFDPVPRTSVRLTDREDGFNVDVDNFNRSLLGWATFPAAGPTVEPLTLTHFHMDAASSATSLSLAGAAGDSGSSLALDMTTGDGNDAVDVSVNGIDDVALRLDTGGGDDDAKVVLVASEPELAGRSRRFAGHLSLGSGNDALYIETEDFPDVDLNLSAGEGNDDVASVNRTGDRSFFIDETGILLASANLGGGNDRYTADVEGFDQALLEVLAGDGDDEVEIEAAGIPEGRFALDAPDRQAAIEWAGGSGATSAVKMKMGDENRTSLATESIEATGVGNLAVAVQSPLGAHAFQGQASGDHARRYLYFAKIADVESFPDLRSSLTVQADGYEHVSLNVQPVLLRRDLQAVHFDVHLRLPAGLRTVEDPTDPLASHASINLQNILGGDSVALDVAGFQRVHRRLADSTIGDYRETIVGTPEVNKIDQFTLDVTIAPDGVYDSRVDLGEGDDVFEHLIGDLVVAGSYSQVVEGGAGSDWLRMAQTFAGVPVVIPAGGTLESLLLGGDGDDLLESLLSYQVAGSLSVQLSGGSGNDWLRGEDTITLPEGVVVDSRLDPARPRKINYFLDGGAGEDQLELWLELADELDNFFAALIDGGDGFDTCLVAPGTPNVLVHNCEDDRETR